MKPKLLVSSSVINFRKKAEKIWGLKRYRWPRDMFKPIVFFGMYHIGDYVHYILHLGPRTIFWCGSDIISLCKNFFPWYILFGNADHYVENLVEHGRLSSLGIIAKVRPSFLEDVNDFPVSYKHSDRPSVFITAHPFREKEYGVYLVIDLAKELSDIDFHIYGISGPTLPNVFFHGIVPEWQFNEEIKYHQCGLRPNVHDGNSEVPMKSVLCGAYPITRIKYDMIDNYRTKEELVELLKDLKNKKKPNLEARDYWREKVNDYPWMR